MAKKKDVSPVVDDDEEEGVWEDEGGAMNAGPAPPTAPTAVPLTFWQELIALLLQLFGRVPAAAEHPQLMRQLQDLHSRVTVGEPPSNGPQE
jgi:hypothetical protein